MAKRKFATDTRVPVARTRSEIETMLTEHGCDEFVSRTSQEREVVEIGFIMNGLHFLFSVPMATKPAEDRRRWRALFNVIKFKLVAIDDGISTFEREFMANVVTPDGQSVADAIIPQLAALRDGARSAGVKLLGCRS